MFKSRMFANASAIGRKREHMVFNSKKTGVHIVHPVADKGLVDLCHWVFGI